MKKRVCSFIAVFSLILLTFVILEACSKKPIPAQQTGDLKKYSLSAKELPDLGIVFELNLGKDEMSPNAVSGYAANFGNKVKNTSSSGYKSLSINLQSYNTAEDAKKYFSRNMLPNEVIQKFQEIKTKGMIGDESFVYSADVSKQRRVYALYRTGNVAVQLSSIGIGTNNTVRYARIIESKFKK